MDNRNFTYSHLETYVVSVPRPKGVFTTTHLNYLSNLDEVVHTGVDDVYSTALSKLDNIRYRCRKLDPNVHFTEEVTGCGAIVIKAYKATPRLLTALEGVLADYVGDVGNPVGLEDELKDIVKRYRR